MFILKTRDGDVWEYDTLDEARRNQYIFGGEIIVSEDIKETSE